MIQGFPSDRLVSIVVFLFILMIATLLVWLIGRKDDMQVQVSSTAYDDKMREALEAWQKKCLEGHNPEPSITGMYSPLVVERLPELEVECPHCNGKGENYSELWGPSVCSMCNGSGWKSTEFGRKILDLLDHNGR